MANVRNRTDYKYVKDLPVKITDWVGSNWSLLLHTLLFAGFFGLYLLGYNFEKILLVLTTLVSLEAIYLAIFIQMTVNRNTQSLQEVEEDLDEIQEDVQGMEKDIDEIQEDIQEDDMTEAQTKEALGTIEAKLQNLIKEIETLRKNNP